MSEKLTERPMDLRCRLPRWLEDGDLMTDGILELREVLDFAGIDAMPVAEAVGVAPPWLRTGQ